MPVSSSTFPARPPQPSWRARSRMSRISRSRLGHVRLGDHPLLAAAVADDAEEPRREGAQRLVQGLGGRSAAGRCRSCASAAWRRTEARHDFSPVAWRTNSRNSASAASPRRWCSSGVISGTSPRLPRPAVLRGDDGRRFIRRHHIVNLPTGLLAGGGDNRLTGDRRGLSLPLSRRALVAVGRGDDAAGHVADGRSGGWQLVCGREGPPDRPDLRCWRCK